MPELTGQTIPVVMRNSFLIKSIQPDQSNLEYYVRRVWFFSKNSWKKPISFQTDRSRRLVVRTDQPYHSSHNENFTFNQNCPVKLLEKSVFHRQNDWSGYGPAGQCWHLESVLLKWNRLAAKTTTFHVQHTLWHISLPSLHDYQVKLPFFTFYRECEQTMKNLSFSFQTWIFFLRIRLQ